MFGTLGILDRLHGTDSLFRKSKAHERHFLLLGLTPANQVIPDDPKKGDGGSARPCDHRIRLLSKRKESCYVANDGGNQFPPVETSSRVDS